ncbi:MAG: DNA replication and repair protein RecF [Bacteroidetes bacterium]|nr:MAG: DNA replication and repair protein RecF [Bacteroidota bacterium]
MHLKQIHIVNFKNYREATIVCSPRLNCFTGLNGAGKTNILDAVYYLSYCKSGFHTSDQMNIHHEADFFALHGAFSVDENPDDKVSCVLKRGSKKSFSLNHKEYQRLADHIGRFPLVMISPYDQDLINNGSEVRRRYFDSVISQFDALYLENLIQYNRALSQRNALLKQLAESSVSSAEALEVWDDQLVRYGEQLYYRRKSFAKDFVPLLQQFYARVSGGKERVAVEYLSRLHETDLALLLKNSVAKDRVLKYTTTGIHRDDFAFVIDEYPIKRYGSQGQQKSFYIAVKLAQFEYTRQQKGFKPILLLDDIFDKLDDARVGAIVQLVGENRFGQVFITDTQSERIERLVSEYGADYLHFIVEDAVVSSTDKKRGHASGFSQERD